MSKEYYPINNIKIDKGIPIPFIKTDKSKAVLLFIKMEHGDSIYFKNREDGRNASKRIRDYIKYHELKSKIKEHKEGLGLRLFKINN